MLISQLHINGAIQVAVREQGQPARLLSDSRDVYALAIEAARSGQRFADLVHALGVGDSVDLEAACRDGALALPIVHPDPTHMHLTGTGLTHLGSASARDAMHKKLDGDEAPTDSMKMFRMGLEGGRPGAGHVGAQPEWFYKGNGHMAVAPGQPLVSPHFAEDAGEEPEIAGIYVIGPNGDTHRLGLALANEFSDHLTERVNYLWLAHSKLRNASFGPEILVADMPQDIRGKVRIERGGEILWQKPFLSGEANMSHSLANLEYHNFKYPVFRQPGDVHVHMFGTATLSFSDGISTQAGDIFEIEAEGFGLPLRNPLVIEKESSFRIAAL